MTAQGTTITRVIYCIRCKLVHKFCDFSFCSVLNFSKNTKVVVGCAIIWRFSIIVVFTKFKFRTAIATYGGFWDGLVVNSERKWRMQASKLTSVHSRKLIFSAILTDFVLKTVVINGEIHECRSHISFTW